MKPTDAKLVAGFLIREFQSFAEHLDDCGIDPTEASMIIEEIACASGGGIPTCIEQFFGPDQKTTLTDEERYIADVIKAARAIQEFLWADMNGACGLEEFRRMFRKRVARIDAIRMDNPHWQVELNKRLLQTAAICVNLMAKTARARITFDGIHPTLPSNLPEYGKPTDHTPGRQACNEHSRRSA
ncbi:hypothetical protein [uncultured Desulfosarcina sp.]|uniref:hypothetical protein n=1 Tax=uncultured Desulfosarcina sp. TaxID=218289 RepID=UPI0029C67849|nr:hypothetical protein [uncultured Desulfosarcina sp.]